REVRPDESRRDDRHAQLIAGLLAQTLGDGAHGELRAGIDRLVRYSLMSCCRSDVDEMPETLLAEDRKRCGDAVQNTFDVDVDHLLPIIDAQVVEGRNGHNAGIVDENVKLAVPLTCQLDKVGQVFAPFYVGACIGGLTARIREAARQSLKAIRSPRPKHDLRTALSEQERSCLTYS